jgi:hypothetical protein
MWAQALLEVAESVGPTDEVYTCAPVTESPAMVCFLQRQYPWILVYQCAVADQLGHVAPPQTIAL